MTSTLPAAGRHSTRPASSEFPDARPHRKLGLVLAAVVLAATVLASISVGAAAISPSTIVDALLHYDDTIDAHVTIHELRIPRTVVGLIVGPALGLCGALTQAYTRNPLADPGVLGVNAGAMFAVAVAIGLLGVTAPLGYIWFALLGAAVVTGLVYLLGSIGGGRATPAKLLLAGVAITAALGGLTTALILKQRETFDSMRYMQIGSIGGRDLVTVLGFAPLIVVGILLGAAAARSLNALALGDAVAAGHGVRTGLLRTGVLVSITLLAGTATAIAGPIGFVGLMVPHVVRWFVGPDQRWIFAYTLLVAPALLLFSDVLGRIILPSGELRVGLVTAFVGAPVLILLARRKSVSGL
ncbi:iron chelate uptake ABC transporter family permease subunit [Gordonia alkaliphila]|uniref:FecCD family ABC transporter permease n=1 Tax=Gordonia alkaliphila TaxID=1053547 RepID=UPI001FF65B28|nr:iron chelate uptake ABC transporter family permease subunit [Gordonia alkaliphila]MCK0439383.1 iron chelate uptake ABC transporter family permease subunit [Gordonia alkaliphila]